MTNPHKVTHITAHQDDRGDWTPYLVTETNEYRIENLTFDTQHSFIAWATDKLKDLPIKHSLPLPPITPEQFTEYLQRTGRWIPEGTSRGATSWRPLHPTTTPVHALIPQPHQHDDDPELIEQALHTIAQVEGHHPDNLRAHIANDKYMRPGILRYR